MALKIDDDNVIDELNMLLLNVPQNVSTLEKTRWLYMKVGELFSYDYRILINKGLDFVPTDIPNDYISRYQNCIRISKIFNLMLNYIDGCTAEVVERPNVNIRGVADVKHVANEVKLDSGEKLMLDLTLDLYLIQSGCRTKQFGYTDPDGTYDIISQRECEIMDKKMGLSYNGDYLDDKIQSLKEIITKDTNIDDLVNSINKLIPKFIGYHEGYRFIEMLFSTLLPNTSKIMNLKQTTDFTARLCSIVCINDEEFFIFNQNIGLIKTSKSFLRHIISDGWYSDSPTFNEILGINKLK